MRSNIYQSDRMGKLVRAKRQHFDRSMAASSEKGTEPSTVTYEQALESALCYGWIDGQKQAGEKYWLQRFTPRSAKSIWSKLNKDKAEGLIAAGRMRPPGMCEIEKARKDGRWKAAYTSASNSIVPDDLQVALDANPGAKKFLQH